MPVDCNEGAAGDQLLEVRLPNDLDLADFELVEDDGGAKGYREWCIPAKLLNEQAGVRLLDDDEANTAWLRRREHRPVTDPAPGR